jgi:hypothetical protein
MILSQLLSILVVSRNAGPASRQVPQLVQFERSILTFMSHVTPSGKVVRHKGLPLGKIPVLINDLAHVPHVHPLNDQFTLF